MGFFIPSGVCGPSWPKETGVLFNGLVQCQFSTRIWTKGSQLVAVGSCGIHTLHNAVRSGFFKWQVEKPLRAHTSFHNVPARKEEKVHHLPFVLFAVICGLKIWLWQREPSKFGHHLHGTWMQWDENNSQILAQHLLTQWRKPWRTLSSWPRLDQGSDFFRDGSVYYNQSLLLLLSGRNWCIHFVNDK